MAEKEEVKEEKAKTEGELERGVEVRTLKGYKWEILGRWDEITYPYLAKPTPVKVVSFVPIEPPLPPATISIPYKLWTLKKEDEEIVKYIEKIIG